jgi:hypothetical protein
MRHTEGKIMSNMQNKCVLIGVLSVFTLIEVANAQTGSGTLGVTATVQGSINLTFVTDASGLAVTGTTTSTASLPFGTVRMYGGTVPANVTKTVNATSFDLSTPFDVRVDLANSASTTYTLAAMLAAADATNTWTLGPTDISAGASHALTSTGTYASALPYTLKLTVPASEAAGLITNTINFTATAN